MANWTRLRRQSHAPRELDGTETIYAAADGTLKHMDPEGSVTNLAGEGSLPSPSSEGDVLTVVDGDWAGEAPSGGSQPGAVRVLKYDFDFTQAVALADGVPVWTPAVGDWLLNAWFAPDAWDADGAVSPRADIGVISAGAWATLRGGPQGLFGALVGAVDLSANNWIEDTKYVSYGGPTAAVDLLQAMLLGYTNAGSGALPPQVKFSTTDPLSLVVSDDGTPGGSAFDGSAGASTLYLAVCSPDTTP